MRRMFILRCAAVAILLLLFACGDDTPSPYKMYCTVNGAGSMNAVPDGNLKLNSLGKAFYLTDDLVFHLGDVLTSHSLNTGMHTPLTPDNVPITDKQYLAIDRQQHVLYCAAGDAIYQVGFDGSGFTKLSPDGEGIYSAPALSPDGQYLTAIHDGYIARLNLGSGEWNELAAPEDAFYAIYTADQDAYYSFTLTNVSVYQDQYLQLFKQDALSQTPISLMVDVRDYSDFVSFNVDARISPDGNYLAMLFTMEPIDTGGYLTGHMWQRFPVTLNIYDRNSGAVSQISDCFAYSFVQNTGELLYSHLKYGMADLIRMDLSTGVSFMVWDGYHEKDYYSYSVTAIYPRDDGGKIHLDAWKRSRVKIDPNDNTPYN